MLDNKYIQYKAQFFVNSKTRNQFYQTLFFFLDFRFPPLSLSVFNILKNWLYYDMGKVNSKKQEMFPLTKKKMFSRIDFSSNIFSSNLFPFELNAWLRWNQSSGLKWNCLEKIKSYQSRFSINHELEINHSNRVLFLLCFLAFSLKFI